jgi:hypothetical protein
LFNSEGFIFILHPAKVQAHQIPTQWALSQWKREKSNDKILLEYTESTSLRVIVVVSVVVLVTTQRMNGGGPDHYEVKDVSEYKANYEKLKELGRGKFGIVYEVRPLTEETDKIVCC